MKLLYYICQSPNGLYSDLTCLTAAVHLVAAVYLGLRASCCFRLADTVAQVCPAISVVRRVNAVGMTPRLLLARQLTRLAVAVSVTEVEVIRWVGAARAACELIQYHSGCVKSLPADS